MADLNKYVQTNTFYQAGSGSIIGATSVVLTSLTDIYGNVLTMTDFGTTGYITLEPDTTNEEGAIFTGVTANANGTYTLTGVSTILAKDPYTATSGLVRQHSGGTKVVVTDNVKFWASFANKANDETITGVWLAPVGGTGAQIATNTDIANAVSGASGTATDSVFGTVKLSVAALSVPNPIAVGDNDGRVPTQGENDALVGNNTDIAIGTGNKFVSQTGLQHNAEKYAADAQANDTYVITLSPIPTSYTNGMVVYFKANTINTGAATINVNSLGAKTIVKYVNTTLADGDIAAGMFCTVIYDGTNFVLQNPIANVVSNTIISTSGVAAGSTGTQTITHGLGKIPQIIRINGYGSTASANANHSSSVGVYDSSGNRCVYVAYSALTPTSSAAFAIYLANPSNNGSGVIQNVTSTSFDIVWTVSGGNLIDTVLMWEAQ